MKKVIDFTLAIAVVFIIVTALRVCPKPQTYKTSDSSESITSQDIRPIEAGIMPQIGQKMTNTAIYVNRFKDVAVKEMVKYGIPASITLAQGIIESRSGQSDLARIDKNHFGIKCKKNCIGCRCVNYADDSPYDMFRIFKTDWESFREHSKLLVTAQRYKSLFKLKKTDYKGWARGLQKAGYATSKTYAKALIRVIEKNNLQRFDY